MLRSKITSWFFLGYLVLLLNFGPSVHHAPIFGLHGQHSHSVDSSEAHSCCCCHSHFGSTLIPSLAEEMPANAESVEGFNNLSPAQHSCAFCKFFDEYNVVVASFECDLNVSPFSLFLSELPDGAFAEFVPNVARGPPTA